MRNIFENSILSILSKAVLVSCVSIDSKLKCRSAFFLSQLKSSVFFLLLFVCFKFTSTEKFTSQEGKLSALKPGHFLGIESPRTRPKLETANSKKESPVVQKLAAPDEEKMNQGGNLPVAEESEKPLFSKVRFSSFFMTTLSDARLHTRCF